MAGRDLIAVAKGLGKIFRAGCGGSCPKPQRSSPLGSSLCMPYCKGGQEGECDDISESQERTTFEDYNGSRSSPANGVTKPVHPQRKEGNVPGTSRHMHTWCYRRYHVSAWLKTMSDTTVARDPGVSRSEEKRKEQRLTSQAKEKAVPSSRIGRAASFGGLAASLGVGTTVELTRRSLGLVDGQQDRLANNPFFSPANVERIVSTLCRMRGAALKLGQMISLQDSNLVPEPLQEIFRRVRSNADFMPSWQMKGVLEEELGPDWRERLKEFDTHPLAAASIGQVHEAVLHDGTRVAMKIQYPGVAQSINSDINNLVMILKYWNVFPEGLFVDNLMTVMRRELAWETDYLREAQCCSKFGELLASEDGVSVPRVIPELTTVRVLTTELVEGVPLDECCNLPQETRNKLAEVVLRLCLRELFEFQFMQTDPNWSNFFYNSSQDKVYLLDFGATRSFPREFVEQYMQIIHGAAKRDRDQIVHASTALGFLSGYESKVMVDAHTDAILILGEPFAQPGEFDFGAQDTTRRIHNLLPVLMEHRLTPPPEEIYSLHRKMAGAFLLCTKLGAIFDCYSLFHDVFGRYQLSKT